jgi:2-haloacid dehalogenase
LPNPLFYLLTTKIPGLYENFYDVTFKSLQHALMENSIAVPSAFMNIIVHSYSMLLPFPDVAPAFSALFSSSATESLIFSNGSSEMIAAAISNSEFVAGTKYVSVEDTQRYKPDPETYKYLLGKLGRWGDPKSVFLVSANPFDIVGASNAGLETVWVDREGAGWRDGLGKPQHVVRSLEEALEVVNSGK